MGLSSPAPRNATRPGSPGRGGLAQPRGLACGDGLQLTRSKPRPVRCRRTQRCAQPDAPRAAHGRGVVGGRVLQSAYAGRRLYLPHAGARPPANCRVVRRRTRENLSYRPGRGPTARGRGLGALLSRCMPTAVRRPRISSHPARCAMRACRRCRPDDHWRPSPSAP